MGKYLKTNYPGAYKYIGRCGVSYGIDYYAEGKKHREIVGPLLGEARTKLEEVRAQSKRGGFISLASQRRISFAELAGKYAQMEQGKPYFEGSKRHFLKTLVDHFGQKKLCQITPLDIEGFKKIRKETLLPNGKVRADVSFNRELETLRHLFNKGVLWGMILESPFSRFKESIFFEERNDRCRYLAEEEIKRLLAACPAYLERIVRGALLTTGLRKSDLLNLKWSDIDWERKIFTFAEGKKRGKRGAKVITNDLGELLQEIPRNGSQYIFTGSHGKPVQDVKSAFHTALKKAGIEDFHFHDLRHTSASYLVMRGASMKAVQEHLGHSSLSMTERYAHLSPDFLQMEVRKLDGVFRKEEFGKKLVRSSATVGFSENLTGVQLLATADQITDACLETLALTPCIPVSD